MTGSTPDNETLVPLLRQHQATRQLLPQTLIMDQAGGWDKTRAQVAAVSGSQTQVVALIPQSGGADLARFTLADF